MTGIPRRLPDVRDVRERLSSELTPYRRWWVVAPVGDRVLGMLVGLLVVVLAGAFLFAVVHIVGGWIIRGNWHAGLFGVGLAAVTGGLLAAVQIRVPSRCRR